MVKNLQKKQKIQIKMKYIIILIHTKKIFQRIFMGLIHGDIFPDNIFYYKNKFNGFIDFYFSFYGSYVYEIAIAVNSMCFTKGYFDEKNIIFLLKVISLQETYQN